MHERGDSRTDLKGIEIAAALGCVAGKSEYGLEVLKDARAEDVAEAQRMLREGRVRIELSSSPRSCISRLSAGMRRKMREW